MENTFSNTVSLIISCIPTLCCLMRTTNTSGLAQEAWHCWPIADFCYCRHSLTQVSKLWSFLKFVKTLYIAIYACYFLFRYNLKALLFSKYLLKHCFLLFFSLLDVSIKLKNEMNEECIKRRFIYNPFDSKNRSFTVAQHGWPLLHWSALLQI